MNQSATSTRDGGIDMVKQVSSMFLALLMIIFMLTACGGDKTTISTVSPELSPSAASESVSPTEAPTATPQASTVATVTPEATVVKSSAAPTATPAATATPTASAKPAATAKPTVKPTVKPTATPKTEESGAEAEALFKQSCTSCHGVDLEGDIGPNLQKIGGHLTKAQITAQITDGGTVMPPFGKRLKTEEIETLAAWLSAKK
jgi:cytochrome c551